jgi:putative IMPACT (imprinted ancient) family translation regulator
METIKIIEGQPYVQKGSKFLGFLRSIHSVGEFKQFMEDIKKTHKKASHYCYAYVLNEYPPLLEGQGALPIRKEKYSNDGEPSGCGSAILNLIKANNLENYAVIVVRYFGGVLLGAGNLVRAYANSAKNALGVTKRELDKKFLGAPQNGVTVPFEGV